MKIIWSPLSIEQLSEISTYIAQDKPMAAENWVEEVFSKVGNLEFSPYIGRIVPEMNNEQFREIIYKNYRIIYRVEKERISVLTVQHGKQILPTKELKE